MSEPSIILDNQGNPKSVVHNDKVVRLDDEKALSNNIPFVPFNPMGIPNMVGPNQGQTLSQWDTLFENLRWYLISNNRQLISQCITEIGLIRTICDLPVSDGLRGGIEIKTEQLDEKQIRQLQRLMELKRDIYVAGRAVSKMRGFGGGGVVVLTNQDPNKELDIDAIRADSPLEFKAADLWELFWDAPNIDSPNEYLEGYDPNMDIENVTKFRYYGINVDRTRVLPLVGIDPPSFVRPRLRGWGLSELEILIRGINQFLKSNNLAFEVLDEFKVDVYKIKNLLNALLTPIGQANVRNRVTLANQIKNFQHALVMDSEDDFDHKQLSFAGIAEMMAQFRIQICGDMRMPMTKLFGISLSGLSSTDEGDFEVYNGMVESEVRGKIKHPLLVMTSLRCQQMFGFIPDDLEIGLKPLRVLSAEGEENVKNAKFTRLIQAAQANKITDKEFRERCNHGNLLEKPLDIEEARLNPDELKEDPAPGEGKQEEAPKPKLEEPNKNSIIDKIKKLINGKVDEEGLVEQDWKGQYEKAGGDTQYTNEQLMEKINSYSNGPVWEKAKEASQAAFGQIKWPFVMWWYEKHGGK